MPRAFFTLCLLLANTLPSQAQGEKPKPNTLTPKEISDGWILLFDGETTFGWECEGVARVVDGWLVLEGKKAQVIHTARWISFDVGFDCQAEGPGESSARMTLTKTAGHNLNPRAKTWGTVRMLYSFDRESGSCRTGWELKGRDRVLIAGGGTFRDRKQVHEPAPRFGFEVERGAKLKIRNLKLKPLASAKIDQDNLALSQTLGLESLFNGKNLAGWKEFPGKKSKFAVIDGAINVQNGPGDLQTVGKYQDFVLQLECISNGKHLNSGIFFRCRDNEYQNGYEAQIRNQFTPEATQDYTIEEYDPKTNKLIGKKKIKSTAVDYGTGAIYRRQPARKEMAKDGEWFGMTIVAHGNHLATWVNGVQVTDWHDNRPKSDNARTGCKLEAGHISIQGHDPTTNLSFRNFRIAELK